MAQDVQGLDAEIGCLVFVLDILMLQPFNVQALTLCLSLSSWGGFMDPPQRLDQILPAQMDPSTNSLEQLRCTPIELVKEGWIPW